MSFGAGQRFLSDALADSSRHVEEKLEGFFETTKPSGRCDYGQRGLEDKGEETTVTEDKISFHSYLVVEEDSSSSLSMSRGYCGGHLVGRDLSSKKLTIFESAWVSSSK